MELLHGADHIGDVFDHVHGAQVVEGVIAKRIGEAVEVAQNVGVGARIAIDAERTRIFVDAAADVEDAGHYAARVHVRAFRDKPEACLTASGIPPVYL